MPTFASHNSVSVLVCFENPLLIPGGYFGFGWFRDLWRIPEYVKDANDDPDYLRWLAEKMRDKKKPPFSVPKIKLT
jgi:hypothetical protein